MKYTIGVDLGTTNLCALLVNSKTYEVECISSEKNDTLIVSSDPACFEQDAGAIVDKTLKLIKELIIKADVEASDVSGVAITGQMHGVVLVDSELHPMTPLYTWRDRRSETTGVLDEVSARLPEKYEDTTGCRLAGGFGGATLAWLLKNSANKSDITSYKALSIADYLAAVLTGRICTDYSNAASWGIFDISHNKWYDDMLSRLEIPVEMLPEVVKSGKVLGCVLPEIAEKTLLHSEAKVWVPVGDNQASYFGATQAEQNMAVINIGTSGQITIPASNIYTENGMETRPLPGGDYIWVGATLCGGWSYEYLAKFFLDVITKLGHVEIERDVLYDRMKSLLGVTSASCGGGLSVITTFSGTRSGVGSQSGRIIGIDEGNLTAGNMIYGFLSGIVEELASMLPKSDLVGGWDELVATGNAIRLNPAMLKIIEDVFGKKCEMSIVSEEAASGAAFIAIKVGE